MLAALRRRLRARIVVGVCHTHQVLDADAALTQVIQSMAGPQARPRDDQFAAVRSLVNDRARVLVVQATGWGKSAVYWAATTALRAQGRGPTVVVSPLLALMRDQVTAAGRAGLRAATVNSTNVDDWDDVIAATLDGSLDVLLISPERLANPRFAAVLPKLLSAVGMVVIDEAHCISDWGFDFRPDYQRLASSLVGLAQNVPVLATTATANARVTSDVAAQLGPNTVTLRGSLARSSLRLSVVPGLRAIERYAWVNDAVTALPGSGIIYALTIAETNRIADFLSSQGHAVAAYSGALEPADRERIESELRANQLKAVVATSALGMGYDKPDLAFCIHVGSPASPVAYYQQVGRAGRALDDAVAVLLPAESDEAIWEHFATVGVPDEVRVGAILRSIQDVPKSVLVIEGETSIRRGRLEGLLKILAVEGVVAKEGSQWAATGKPWVFDTERWAGLAQVRANEANLMRTYAGGSQCLMCTLQIALDDPDPQPCGRCSACTGELPPPGRTPTESSLTAAKAFTRSRDVVIEPRKLWPNGSPKKGKIAGCDEGRALAFADDPGWNDVVSRLTDSAASEELLDGMVAVLSRWRRSWSERPTVVVPMPSSGFGRLNRSIAEHLSQVGKLLLVDPLSQSGPPPSSDQPSVAQVRARLERLSIEDSGQLGGAVVLLVDAQYRTGWGMTVAASLLRDAGARRVLPLAVHQLP